MKRCLFLFGLLIALVYKSTAQNGALLQKQPLEISDTIWKRIQATDSLKEILSKVNLYKITYRSDGLKVIGFVAEPKQPGVYPCIITNRGGRWNFGLWNAYWVAHDMGRMASWGYVVIASQYRGSVDGSEGKDEYGGADVNDVFNLIPVLGTFKSADTSRIGLDGESRGGMMTYLAMKRSCRFKAATVTAGLADVFDFFAKRPALEDTLFRNRVVGYDEQKEQLLRERSAVYWAEQLCKTTPLLIMHGSADWRASPSQSLDLVNKLYQHKHPVRFILFEGADHGITEWRQERMTQMRRHFDYYLRDQKPWPSMEPHGR